MAKTIIKLKRKTTRDVRNKIKFFYTEKFFNKWMSKYLFAGLNYQQSHYIMKKLWAVGTIACSQISSANEELAGLMKMGSIDMGTDKLIFTPWAFANRYNIYDFPTHARLINTRGVKFITNKELALDKEVVIGWAQKNHKSVFSSIEAKLNELVDVEMIKRVSRKAQNQPWMFTFSPEDREQAEILQEQMENDNPYLFAPFNEPDKVKGISSGAPYIVDKLEQDRQKIENDILTMLGVQNVGVGEKKEHLIVDEVNANNEDIEQQAISYKSEIEDFFERINKAFKVQIVVYDMNEIMAPEQEQEQESEEEPEDVSEN